MMVESRNKQVKMDRERVVRGINSFLELCELAPNQVRICGGGCHGASRSITNNEGS